VISDHGRRGGVLVSPWLCGQRAGDAGGEEEGWRQCAELRRAAPGGEGQGGAEGANHGDHVQVQERDDGPVAYGGSGREPAQCVADEAIVAVSAAVSGEESEQQFWFRGRRGVGRARSARVPEPGAEQQHAGGGEARILGGEEATMAGRESGGREVEPGELGSGGIGAERERSGAVPGAGIVAFDVGREAGRGGEWRERERVPVGGREGEIDEQGGREPDPKTCGERGAARCGQRVGVAAAEGVANAAAEPGSGGECAADGEFAREAGAAEVAGDEHGEGVRRRDEQEHGSGGGQGAAAGAIVDDVGAGAARDPFVSRGEADDLSDVEPVWERGVRGAVRSRGGEAQSDSDSRESGDDGERRAGGRRQQQWEWEREWRWRAWEQECNRCRGECRSCATAFAGFGGNSGLSGGPRGEHVGHGERVFGGFSSGGSRGAGNDGSGACMAGHEQQVAAVLGGGPESDVGRIGASSSGDRSGEDGSSGEGVATPVGGKPADEPEHEWEHEREHDISVGAVPRAGVGELGSVDATPAVVTVTFEGFVATAGAAESAEVTAGARSIGSTGRHGSERGEHDIEFRDRRARAGEEGADTAGGSAVAEDPAQSVAAMAVRECTSRSSDECAESSR
jgi:hypothetical protein